MDPRARHVPPPRRARLANAAAAQGVGLGAFGRTAGVDVLSFGGTKNGALGAEAVVSFRPVDETALPHIRKQAMQLASKMRFVAAQFTALLSGDLWLENASHANAMARRLAEEATSVPGVSLAYPVQANAVFALVPGRAIAALRDAVPFYVWDESTGLVRWMCSFDTTEADVDRLVGVLTETIVGLAPER